MIRSIFLQKIKDINSNIIFFVMNSVYAMIYLIKVTINLRSKNKSNEMNLYVSNEIFIFHLTILSILRF